MEQSKIKTYFDTLIQLFANFHTDVIRSTHVYMYICINACKLSIPINRVATKLIVEIIDHYFQFSHTRSINSEIY